MNSTVFFATTKSVISHDIITQCRSNPFDQKNKRDVRLREMKVPDTPAASPDIPAFSTAASPDIPTRPPAASPDIPARPSAASSDISTLSTAASPDIPTLPTAASPDIPPLPTAASPDSTAVAIHHQIDLNATSSTLLAKTTEVLRCIGVCFRNGLCAVADFLCALARITLYLSVITSPLWFIGSALIMIGGWWTVGFPMVVLSVCIVFFGSVLQVAVQLCT